MDELKRIWPEWQIVELLDRGSYGTVYRAKRTVSGYGETYSAIKVINLPLNDAEMNALQSSGMDDNAIRSYFREMTEKLKAEISILDSLGYVDEIVHIQDFKIVEDPHQISWRIYIRMELLENINDYMKRHSFTVNDVVKMGMDVCKALVTCQKKGIIHGDIKPTNILVDGRGIFKLGDFGITRHVGDNRAISTQAGEENYVAPEIYRGESYDQTADIYSLGITMYQLLNNGRMPFLPPYPNEITSKDKMKSRVKMLQGKPIPAPALADQNLAKIIKRACEFISEKRYQNAQQMLDDLERWCRGQELAPRESRRPSKARSNQKPKTKPKAKSKLKFIIPILTAFIVVVVAAGSFFIWGGSGKTEVDLLYEASIVYQEENDDTISIVKKGSKFTAYYDEDDENAVNFVKSIKGDNYEFSKTEGLSVGDKYKVTLKIDEELLKTYKIKLTKKSITIKITDEDLILPKSNPGPSEKVYYYADVNHFLSLRSEPNTSASVIDRIPPKGKMLYLGESSGVMYKVQVVSSGLIGWVHSGYVVTNPADCTKASQSSTETSKKSSETDIYHKPFYGIICAAFESEENALDELEKCRHNLEKTEIVVSTDWSGFNTKKYYLVLGGKYNTRGEAEAELKNVREFYPDAYVNYSGSYQG